MHFEIDRPQWLCDRVWSKLSGEDEMTPEQAKQLDYVYRRISGRDAQRYLKGGPALESFTIMEELPAGGDPAAWPARSADVGDVITILRYIQAALSGIDQLRAQLAAGGAGDTAALVSQLRDALGDDLAGAVAARLTVTPAAAR